MHAFISGEPGRLTIPIPRGLPRWTSGKENSLYYFILRPHFQKLTKRLKWPKSERVMKLATQISKRD